MEPSSIGFLILLAAMGGGIAYLADMVGKKLGKKRLSLFGLRPRQTAALGTICLGVLITIVTISFALIASSGMRQSLLHAKDIRTQLVDLEGQLNARSLQNKRLSGDNDGLTKRIKQTSGDLAVLQIGLSKAKNSLVEFNDRIVALQRNIGNLTFDARKKKTALERANKMLKDTSLNLTRVKRDLDRNTDQLRAVERDNKSVMDQNVQLVDSKDKLQAAQDRLQVEKAKLEQDLTNIKQSVAELQSADDLAQQKLKLSQSDLTHVQTQLTAAKAELADTQAKLEQADRNLGVLMGISDSSRRQPMAYRMDEEVARLKVPAGVSQNAANGALTLLLRRARVAAQQRGSTKASIYDHEAITTDQIIRSTLSQLTDSKVAKVIIAHSSLNAFRGEPVSLEIVVLPDPLVYLAGQLIAETVIDATRGDAAIAQQLTTFLQEKVSQKAKKDGMIPIANSDVSFGQISQSEVLQVIAQLHAANRSIRLQAHAVGDTYAADPLKIEFRLR